MILPKGEVGAIILVLLGLSRVYINPLPNAETVLKLIAEWFEDYNENHPHSGLKMRSPREFRSAQTATA